MTAAGIGKTGTFAKRNWHDHATKALHMWDAFNDSERHGVKFGMFPFDALHKAELEGYSMQSLTHELMHLASQGAR